MAVDMFLKIDGVEGESQDSKHKGEIDVESYSWGASNLTEQGSGSPTGAGKVQLQDFHFVMRFNKASAQLFLACAKGQHIKDAILTVRKAGDKQEDFLKLTMSDLIISSYQTGGSEGAEEPTDQVGINFAKIEVFYKEQKPDGSLTAGWDVQTSHGG